MREKVIDVAIYVAMTGLGALLALWIYGAWLDMQPVPRPKIWHDKTRHVICYWTRHNLTCIPEQ